MSIMSFFLLFYFLPLFFLFSPISPSLHSLSSLSTHVVYLWSTAPHPNDSALSASALVPLSILPLPWRLRPLCASLAASRGISRRAPTPGPGILRELFFSFVEAYGFREHKSYG